MNGQAVDTRSNNIVFVIKRITLENQSGDLNYQRVSTKESSPNIAIL